VPTCLLKWHTLHTLGTSPAWSELHNTDFKASKGTHVVFAEGFVDLYCYEWNQTHHVQIHIHNPDKATCHCPEHRGYLARYVAICIHWVAS